MLLRESRKNPSQKAKKHASATQVSHILNSLTYFSLFVPPSVKKSIIVCYLIGLVILFLTLSLPSTSKTNTSVPSMFQGILNIKGKLVQQGVSPEPIDLLL